jgi:hypothetical protein
MTREEANKYTAEDIAYHLFNLEDTSWSESPEDMAQAIEDFLNNEA